MGQHTWFVKSKELYFKQIDLYDKKDKYEDSEIYLDETELLLIESQISDLEEKNETIYHDVFRTGKRNKDDTYYDGIISSRKECFEFIEDENNFVSFKRTIHETDEQENINKKIAYKRLDEFWGEFPDGLIYFG